MRDGTESPDSEIPHTTGSYSPDFSRYENERTSETPPANPERTTLDNKAGARRSKTAKTIVHNRTITTVSVVVRPICVIRTVYLAET